MSVSEFDVGSSNYGDQLSDYGSDNTLYRVHDESAEHRFKFLRCITIFLFTFGVLILVCGVIVMIVYIMNNNESLLTIGIVFDAIGATFLALAFRIYLKYKHVKKNVDYVVNAI